MKKALYAFAVMAFAMWMACTAALAEEAILYQTGQWTYIMCDGGAKIVCWLPDGEVPTLLIPDEVDGIAVAEIAANAFSLAHGVNLVAFDISPDHPTYAVIDGVLFDKQQRTLVAYPCERKADAYVIPGGTQHIGAYAFSAGRYLTRVTIPDGITSIGDGAFASCVQLKDIRVPGTVRRIGSRAFMRCTDLAGVTLGEGIKDIGRDAFYDCMSLKRLLIPASVTSIEANPFAMFDSHGLYFIDVAKDNPRYEQIDGILFDKQENMLVAYPAGREKAEYAIPEGVERIGESAFRMCPELERVVMPDSVKHIGKDAFISCWALSSMEIPEGVQTIGPGALAKLPKLITVSLPASITDATFCFYTEEEPKGSWIEAIDVSPYNSTYMAMDGVLFDKQGKALIAYPGGREGVYTVPDGVARIESYAFTCTNLTSVVIPEGVAEIGDSPFDWCFRLTHVTMPSSVNIMGDQVFRTSHVAVMRAPTGSIAEQYAKDNDIPYEVYAENSGE